MLFLTDKRIWKNTIGIDQFKRRILKVFFERRYLFHLVGYIMVTRFFTLRQFLIIF